MRSEYVFAAVKEIENRFMLCRVASVSHAACIWIQLGPLTPSTSH